MKYALTAVGPCGEALQRSAQATGRIGRLDRDEAGPAERYAAGCETVRRRPTYIGDSGDKQPTGQEALHGFPAIQPLHP